MRILQTDCTPEQVQKDLPELERLIVKRWKQKSCGSSSVEQSH